MAKEIKFKEWAKSLHETARETLLEHSFDSWQALLNASQNDIVDLLLKPGHRVATLALLQEPQELTRDHCGESRMAQQQ